MPFPALRPMTEVEFTTWLAEAVPAYAADKVASGQWASDAALDLSKKEHDQLLPDGLQTVDNHLYSVVDGGGAVVGVLWFAVRTKFNARIAYVFDIDVWPAHQRQGHGTRALQALEGEVQRLGLTGIALHVFGHNTGAQALYAKLGFQPTNISLFKTVGTAGGTAVSSAATSNIEAA